MPFDFDQTAGWYQPLKPGARYGRTVLAPTAQLPSDDLAQTMTDQLVAAVSDWKFYWESDWYGASSSPVVTALVLMPPDRLRDDDPAQVPSDVLSILRATEAGRLALDLVVFGNPAGKPEAITSGDFGRVPVSVVAARPPHPRPIDELPGRRRPVVALLDTALDAQSHPWLEAKATALGQDGFWVDALDHGFVRGPARPAGQTASAPSLRPLASHEGHGTFAAGLIRQVAPDAQVLSVPIMDDDGTVHSDHILNALGWLHDEIRHGRLVIDVVSLSIGFEPVFPEHARFMRWLGTVLGALGDLGVRVVVSAGNDGTDALSYPAAFTLAENQPMVAVVSVGALNPSGTSRAYYSNFGLQVSEWELGTGLVSIFPTVDRDANPELGPTAEKPPMESTDPDDFRGGYARWSGTSFAAALFAGRLADALAHLPEDVPAELTVEAARARAILALRRVRDSSAMP